MTGSVERRADRLRARRARRRGRCSRGPRRRRSRRRGELRRRVAGLVAGQVEADDVRVAVLGVAARRSPPPPRRRSCGSRRSGSAPRCRRRARVVDALGDPGVVLGVGEADRRGVVGRGDQLDVDRALGGAARQVLVGDVAVVLAACGSRSPRGRRCAGSRGSRPTRSSSALRTRPRGPVSPLRSASRRISAGGAVPSRWTCSSALGSVASGAGPHAGSVPRSPAARAAPRRRP